MYLANFQQKSHLSRAVESLKLWVGQVVYEGEGV